MPLPTIFLRYRLVENQMTQNFPSAVNGTLLQGAAAAIGKGAAAGITRQSPVAGFEGAVKGEFIAGADLEGAGSGPFA